MEIRMDGQNHKGRITKDNERHAWELRILNADGTFLSFFNRQHLEEAGLQIVQCTSGEWEHLQRAGFQPPFKRD